MPRREETIMLWRGWGELMAHVRMAIGLDGGESYFCRVMCLGRRREALRWIGWMDLMGD